MPRKCRKDRSHTKRTFGMENLLLELLVFIHEILSQRTSPAIKITHPEPIEISRSTEKRLQVLIRKAEGLINPFPDRILSCNSKRHIDSVHSHEINLFLPTVKIPPAHRIVESAVIQIVTPFVRRCFLYL